jgi:RimJ/RimL family protein N-acetyltransferase
MELTDGVVVLRRFHFDDAAAVARACDDPDTARFIPSMPSRTPRRTLTRTSSTATSGGRRAVGGLAIAAADDGRLLGAIDVRIAEIGTIGYWVDARERGRDFATRALRLLSRWAVMEGGVERLELTTHPENVASQRVAEKAGFLREGVLRSHMRFAEGRRDSVLFSLLPCDL